MTPITETRIYEKNGVIVTSARLIVGRQTYAIRNVTSVRPDEIRPPVGWRFVSLVFGLIFMAANQFDFSQGGAIAGAVMAGIALFLLLTSRTTYAVVLTTAGSEVRAITSKSEKTVVEIVTALNQAILYPA